MTLPRSLPLSERGNSAAKLRGDVLCGPQQRAQLRRVRLGGQDVSSREQGEGRGQTGVVEQRRGENGDAARVGDRGVSVVAYLVDRPGELLAVVIGQVGQQALDIE